MTTTRNIGIWLYGFSALLLVAAVFWSLWLLALEPGNRKARAKQAALSAELAALEQEALALEAVRQPFRVDGVDPATIARNTFGAELDPEIQIDSESIADDLKLHTITVDYQAIAFSRLMTTVRTAEAMRPPFKWVGCVLEAAPGATGAGRARLTFEQIVWQPSAP